MAGRQETLVFAGILNQTKMNCAESLGLLWPRQALNPTVGLYFELSHKPKSPKKQGPSCCEVMSAARPCFGDSKRSL